MLPRRITNHVDFMHASQWQDLNINCPEGIPADEARTLVSEITSNPELKLHLTEWIGAIVSLPRTLGDQNVAAQRAIELITGEINAR